MPDARESVEVLPLTPDSVELERVAEVNALAWTRNPDPGKIRTKAAQLKEAVQASDPEERCLLKAIRSNRIIGFAEVSRNREGRSTWTFSRLVVHPRHRRSGVATALFEACKGHAGNVAPRPSSRKPTRTMQARLRSTRRSASTMTGCLKLLMGT